MFVDLSWSHMLLVLVVALVVVGPKDLPKLMHSLGRWAAKARAMADQFRRSFDEMARQSELDELRKELDELRNSRPLAGTEQAINDAIAAPLSVSLSKESPAENAEPAQESPAPAPADEVRQSEQPPASAEPSELLEQGREPPSHDRP